MIRYFYGMELDCPQRIFNIYTFNGEYFRQSWTKLYVPVYVICIFILTIHAFDLKYHPFVFLYIFLLIVFIVMHQNG